MLFVANVGGCLKRFFVAFFLCCVYSVVANANVASVQYVNSVIDTKVDASANTQQTMAGDYTITGTLKVPTQPLPSAQ